MKRVLFLLIICSLAACVSSQLSSNNFLSKNSTDRDPQSENQRPQKKRKALVVVSSAKELDLLSPKSVGKIPAGFYLVELAKMLQVFEGNYEFTFVTPDGQAPQVDLNGLDLNFLVQGPNAPWVNALANLRSTDFGTRTRIRQKLGLGQSVESIRQTRALEYQRREKELEIAARLMGRLEVTTALANTSPEAKEYRDEAVRIFNKASAKEFLSLKQVVEKNRDAQDALKLKDYDFVYIPGGHAPMVDLVDNAYLGEVLNVFHENQKHIIAICHGPVALQSAQFRISTEGKPVRLKDFPMKGASLTTVSTFEEKLMLDLGYIHQPTLKEKTNLTYYVDVKLAGAGYQVEYGSAMHLGVQLRPGYPHFVYDQDKLLLTSNGPQGVDEFVKQMTELFPVAQGI